MFRKTKIRSFAALALAATMALAPAIAEARANRGGSSGSRGSQTYSAPPSTATAPTAAAPMQRTTTQPGAAANRPNAAPATGGFLSSGLGRGLMGGLIGAGLVGLLMGNGLMGGLGSMMSMLGLLLQIGLIAALVFFVARWAMNRFGNRQPQPAGAARSALGGIGSGMGPTPAGAGAGFGSGSSALGRRGAFAAPAKLTLAGDDFSAFERLLDETQHAFADENIGKLRTISTPEMASYFTDDVDDLERKGEANRIADVKLLQGDLSEAWSEEGNDYATVAMRFSMIDTMVDRKTGKLLSGDPDKPIEVTEIWTFTRPTGSTPSEWQVSAIQQA